MFWARRENWTLKTVCKKKELQTRRFNPELTQTHRDANRRAEDEPKIKRTVKRTEINVI